MWKKRLPDEFSTLPIFIFFILASPTAGILQLSKKYTYLMRKGTMRAAAAADKTDMIDLFTLLLGSVNFILQ